MLFEFTDITEMRTYLQIDMDYAYTNVIEMLYEFKPSMNFDIHITQIKLFEIL